MVKIIVLETNTLPKATDRFSQYLREALVEDLVRNSEHLPPILQPHGAIPPELATIPGALTNSGNLNPVVYLEVFGSSARVDFIIHSNSKILNHPLELGNINQGHLREKLVPISGGVKAPVEAIEATLGSLHYLILTHPVELTSIGLDGEEEEVLPLSLRSEIFDSIETLTKASKGFIPAHLFANSSQEAWKEKHDPVSAGNTFNRVSIAAKAFKTTLDGLSWSRPATLVSIKPGVLGEKIVFIPLASEIVGVIEAFEEAYGDPKFTRLVDDTDSYGTIAVPNYLAAAA